MQAESQGHDATNIDTLHQELVDRVKVAGYITSPRVEEAFRAVPRHLFLPHLSPQEVYQDRAIMTKMIDGQYVSSSSQPTIMAIMLEQLDLQPGQRVLEIGAGTGYNAALMAHIVGEMGQVVTIDIDDDIVEAARIHLATAGFERVQVICSDGGLGYPDAAPYDRIILTVSSADITPAWREQLRPDGRFLLPLVVRGPQLSVAFEPQTDARDAREARDVGNARDVNYWQSISVRACGFVGLRGAFAEDGDTLQLAQDPGRVILGLGTRRSIHAEHVLALLQGHYRDLTIQVHVSPMEMYRGLNFWIAIHDSLVCDFTAFGEAARSGLLPTLSSSAAPTIDMKMTRAVGLLSNDALALLFPTREAESQSPVPVSTATEAAKQPVVPSLTLHVRSYGDDDALAQRLIEQVQMWDAAGRPDEQRLHIRAYRRDVINEQMSGGNTSGEDMKQESMSGGNEGVINHAPTVGEHDIIIKGKWSIFDFRWY